MTYRIRYHPLVRSDIDAIATWLARAAGPAAASRQLDEIEALIEGLASLPHRGSLREEIAPGLRAIPAGPRAVVAFQVDDQARRVRVLVVSYAGSDWMGRARERA